MLQLTCASLCTLDTLAQHHRHCTAAGRQQLRCFSSVQEQIVQKNNEYPVMIYSKSWCPFCHEVKDLFHGELKVDAMFAELDELGAILPMYICLVSCIPCHVCCGVRTIVSVCSFNLLSCGLHIHCGQSVCARECSRYTCIVCYHRLARICITYQWLQHVVLARNCCHDTPMGDHSASCV